MGSSRYAVDEVEGITSGKTKSFCSVFDSADHFSACMFNEYGRWNCFKELAFEIVPLYWFDAGWWQGEALEVPGTRASAAMILLFNSLSPERFEQNFTYVIFKLISVTYVWGISCKIALIWMPLDLTDDKSTLVQVMAWCRQATSHCLS